VQLHQQLVIIDTYDPVIIGLWETNLRQNLLYSLS